MKNFLLITALITSASISQAKLAEDCLSKASKLVLQAAAPHANQKDSSLSADISKILLYTAPHSVTYVLTVETEINDGASTDYFPAQTWQVKATGSVVECTITEVKALN